MKLNAKQRLTAAQTQTGVWCGYTVTGSDGTEYESITLQGTPFGVRGRVPVTIDKAALTCSDHQGKPVYIRLKADRMTGVGAGVLFIANDTGRMLFLLRSPTSESPGTWCCPGGGVEPGESIDEGVRRECMEEIGFTDPYDLIPMHPDVQGDFTYHNHFAVVPNEFEPALNDEHIDHQWTDEIPQPIHPGLLRSMLAYKEANEAQC